MVRDELPKLNDPGRENAAVLNHWPMRSCAEPSRPILWSVRLGRCPAPKPFVLTATLIGSGLPDWKVAIPFTPHPEISLSANPVTLLPKGCPLPNGRSTM